MSEERLRLTSPEAEYAMTWCQKNLRPQPQGCKSLTWYVAAATLYKAYSTDAMLANEPPVCFNHLWVVMQLAVPGIKTGRIQRMPVFTRVRYYPDEYPVFGV